MKRWGKTLHPVEGFRFFGEREIEWKRAKQTMINGNADEPPNGTSLSNDVHDKAATEGFDQITRLAAFCFNVPIVMIALAESEQRSFISSLGLDRSEMLRADMLCEETIRQASYVEIPDLALPAQLPGVRAVEAARMRSFAGIALLDDAGGAVGAFGIMDSQPRQLKPAEKEQFLALGRLAMNEIMLRRSVGRRDALTGLPNERQLVSDLRAAAVTFAGEYRLLAVIDTFDPVSAQAVTQSLGHGPIDSLIAQLSERLQARLGSQTQIYHIGETRFAFMVDSTASMKHTAFMESLFQFLGRTVLAGGVPMRPLLRAGMVNVRLRDIGMQDALRKAVAATDESVVANRPWTMYDGEHDAQFQRSYDLATGLQRALANDEFYLVYQPRLEFSTGRIVSVEAFVRWRHSVLGTLFPGEFIPIAERTAVMQALTAWVAHTGLAQLAVWGNKFPGLRLSINLSPVDFDNQQLLDTLLQACSRHHVSPGVLEIEVKEGDWIRKASVLKQLGEIRAEGIKVSIDDFGAGYSNSAYLRDIPADVIKLDASLVLDLADNARHQTIVRAILDLARNLGYRTVAEGVESETTMEMLKRWQCDEVQGYLIARPGGAGVTMDVIQRYLDGESNSPNGPAAIN